MALAQDLRAILDAARSAPPGGGGVPSGGAIATRYADPLVGDSGPLEPVVSAAGYILVQDILHPWVAVPWPADLDAPSGWTPLGGFARLPTPRDFARVTQPSVSFIDESNPAFGFVRHAATAAAEAAAYRSLREALAKARREHGLERIAPRVTPGGQPARTARAARRPRASRTPRRPRTPRPPRVPRVNGTKGTLPRRPCRQWSPSGGCQGLIGCNIPAALLGPNVGHSTCNWGPMNANCECVDMGCTGPAASLLKPFLALLPQYWSQESVALKEAQRKIVRDTRRTQKRFAALPPLSSGASATAPTAYAVDARALVAGCACQVWPGWVICPNCTGSPKCTCAGTCIAFPASSGNCGT